MEKAVRSGVGGIMIVLARRTEGGRDLVVEKALRHSAGGIRKTMAPVQAQTHVVEPRVWGWKMAPVQPKCRIGLLLVRAPGRWCTRA